MRGPAGRNGPSSPCPEGPEHGTADGRGQPVAGLGPAAGLGSAVTLRTAKHVPRTCPASPRGAGKAPIRPWPGRGGRGTDPGPLLAGPQPGGRAGLEPAPGVPPGAEAGGPPRAGCSGAAIANEPTWRPERQRQ